MAQSPLALTATELLQAYRRRTLSPVDVVTASIQRIDEVNPQINAIYHVDADRAVAAAQASEQRWAIGAPLGPLDGVPTTIKDALETIGMPSYRGSAAGDVTIGQSDHPTVARMREAGAIILGKNTMCDYGILAAGISSRHGVTRNPWDLSRTTGASSSGAAASVAAGIEPLSIGTDIVGSIRLPASYCGLAGLKPSQGRVPYHVCNSPALTAGPLARSIEDVALHMNVLGRPDKRDYTALAYDAVDYLADLQSMDVLGLRVLVIPELGLGDPVARAVQNRLLEATRMLATEGVQVDVLQAPPFNREDWRPAEAFYQVRALSELSRHPVAEAKKSDVVFHWTRPATSLSAVDHYRNFDAMEGLRARTVALIDGYDFILLPSTPQTAFAADLPGANPDDIFESWANTFLFNLSEQPASNVPAGLDEQGLPIGLQVVGQRFDDAGVLRMSWCLEQVLGRMPMAPLFFAA